MADERQRRILVIEDADPLRHDIMEMLDFEGFQVEGAENGVVGVEKALAYQPDLIICDIMMPEMDGYGVLHSLRQDSRTVSTPFIFLTAKTDRSDIRHGMGLGADDYVTKPFVTSELLDTVHARLQRISNMRQEVDDRIKELSDNIITALPHELRTPLNTIIGFSDMLIIESQRLKPDQTSEWASHIREAAERLYRLIENYLLYVRTEVTLHNRTEREKLSSLRLGNPSTMIHFHALHKVQQYQRDDDLTISLWPDENLTLYISDFNVGKVTEELLDNALKFSAHGTPVTITSKVDDGQYTLTIEDKGRGMSSEQVESIGAYMQFERWLYEQQGSGLGLAIVQRLLELHGGSLKIDSTPQKGTCVTVTLRVAASE